ncbi:MAG TPA: membrane protein insertase YidC [Halothiobacillaceae bacterium]|nr:membrane protein insertase YidC [Halothiobacillaceae bacterium]
MENRRLFLIVALGLTLILLWQAWISDQRPDPAITEQQASQESVVTHDDLPQRTDILADDDRPQVRSSDTPVGETSGVKASGLIEVKTDVFSILIDPLGGVIRQVDLLDYPVDLDQPDKPTRLLEERPGYTYIAQSGLLGQNESPAPDHHTQYRVDQTVFDMGDEDTLTVPLYWEEDGVHVTKTYTFTRGKYHVELTHHIENNSDQPWSGQQYRQITRSDTSRDSFLLYTYTGGVYAGDPIGSGDRLRYEKIDFKDMGRNPVSEQVTNGWVSVIQHYFMSAWIPSDVNQINSLYSMQSQRSGFPVYTLGMISPSVEVAPQQERELSSIFYVGPKVQSELAALAEGLQLNVDYGIFTIIADPIFWLISLFHNWVGNWGWAIVLTTIAIKILFLWPSHISYRSMARMRAITPKLKALKDRYGEDRQRLSQEMMKLYQKEKINPLGGCLPILIQIPVFISLYWVLVESVEFRQAPWVLWIQDLTQRDPYFILPVLMGLSMYIQQKLNPAPIDPMQQKIFKWLPVVFILFFAFFPAGLVLYWFVNNLLSIAHQTYVTRRVEKQLAAQGKATAKANK